MPVPISTVEPPPVVANGSVRSGPIWSGPESDGPQGGVTQSLISRWLVCRERFRLYAVEGLRASEGWNHRIGYGTMWHVCEEHYLGGKDWRGALTDHARREVEQYPLDAQTIEHWWAVCQTQFPVYCEYWEQHPAAKKRIPLLQEHEFHVPYQLPSGRTVLLRGKWDAIEADESIWCWDHKTKGDLDYAAIARQLTFDLQTMFYLVALLEYQHEQAEDDPASPWAKLVRGVTYNCVRRPLSGGKHTIVQHKQSKSKPNGETRDEFYARLAGLIREDPTHFFIRFECEVTADDIVKFRHECLDPILEAMCDWWDFTALSTEPHTPKIVGQREWSLHFRMPYGVYNPLNEGRATDLDNYLATGSDTGLTRVTDLFPELTKKD